MTSKVEVATVFTYPNLSIGTPAQGEAKGLIIYFVRLAIKLSVVVTFLGK